MEKKDLDCILVPSGLLVMMTYHLWLLIRIIKYPTKTVVGVNAINRRLWVQAMMEQDVSKTGVLAVQSLRNNIMASTVLASTAITLSSLIAVLMSGWNKGEPGISVVLGDRSEPVIFIKFLSIFVCFLLAFLLNVQSIRYYSHATILVNVPIKRVAPDPRYQMLTAEYVAATVNRGSYFWSLGLRAFYFSFPLFLWMFGPIPMFLSCFFLVSMFYFFDDTCECGLAGVNNRDAEEHHIDIDSLQC